MNYYVHDRGKNLGIFPLEELRNRRNTGELNGKEMAWCAGMADWQTLDSVLQGPPKQTNRRAIGVVIAGILVLAFVLVAVLAGVTAKRFVNQVRSVRTSRSRIALGQDKRIVAIASKPVIATTNTLTAKDVLKKRRVFRERQYLQNYQKFGDHTSSADADSLRLINAWLVFNFGTEAEQTNLPSLVNLSDKLAADPNCKDPIVLTVAGSIAVQYDAGLVRLERAATTFQDSKYPGYPKFYAAVLYSDKVTEGIRSGWDSKALQYLKEAFADGSIQPEDQDDIAETFVHGWGEAFFLRKSADVLETVKAQGQPFHWLALVLEGKYEIEAAWKARGGGYADSVSQSGWQGFSDHLATVRTSLTEAWALRPEFPLAAEQMMRVSLGSSGLQEMRLWFDRAVAAQIDDTNAWSEMRWGLRPRWNGDLNSMRAFGVMALNTKRFDTGVPQEFFQAVSDLESELKVPPGRHIYGREDIWTNLQEMYEGYIGQANSRQSDWRSAYSAAAYLAGKFPAARTQLEALDWKPYSLYLLGWHADMSLMVPEVAARTGPLGAQIEKAEAMRQSSDFSGALKIYQELGRNTQVDARTQAFIKDRFKILEIEQRLNAGEWVNFLPDDRNFTGWQIERGEWLPLPDGSLEVFCGEYGHAIYSRARVGANFEVKGEIVTESSSTGAFQGGIVIGLPELDSWDWDAFRLKRNPQEGDIVAFSEGWSRNQIIQSALIDSKTNSFYLKYSPGTVTVSVNGQQVFRNRKAPENWHLEGLELHLGLGAFNNMNKTTLRYQNVQVHQLSGALERNE